jgi:hypothetical protein
MRTGALNLYIPKRFADAIMLHLVRNLILSDSALILGIQGAPGEGKTLQCHQALSGLGVLAVPISAHELESRHAGHPAKLLVRRYQYASRHIRTGRARAAVLLIDDIDAGLGMFGKLTQYTVNTQHLNATLMSICDFPLKVGGEDTARVPIIFTANNLNRLYAPLTRAGRMTVFTWAPTVEEKIQVVQTIYSDLRVRPKDVEKLVRLYRRRPLAFFAAVKSKWIDDHLLRLVESVGHANVIESVLSGSEDFLGLPDASGEQLLATARSLAATHCTKDFLKEMRK